MPIFFYSCGAEPHRTLTKYVRGRFPGVFERGKDLLGKNIPVYTTTIEAGLEFEDLLHGTMYYACDGSAGDMKILERGSYVNLIAFLDLYLQKVDKINADIEKQAEKAKGHGR